MSRSASALQADSKPCRPIEHPSSAVFAKEAAELRALILEACDAFSASVRQNDKDFLRGLHIRAKLASPGLCPSTARKLFQKRKSSFRHGSEIDPARIRPRIFPADDEHFSDLFAITRSCWSMPYNKGYGRRLRFVVFDEYHEGVIGIVGLQSPPADLDCRDKLFAFPSGQKLALVNRTMDAYTVGAIPPYSYLLGGKLCAGMISTDSVRQAYWRRYAGRKTLIEGKQISQPLAAVTTTSAFGRSSMYSRLKYKDRLLAEPIGFTRGYGLIHLEHLYDRICSYLRLIDKFKAGGFGNGPKVRWQNIANAATDLGISRCLLQHGVKREVFLFRLAERLEEGMSGGQLGTPLALRDDDFADYWKERWAMPRAARYPNWNQLDGRELIHSKIRELTSN